MTALVPLCLFGLSLFTAGDARVGGIEDVQKSSGDRALQAVSTASNALYILEIYGAPLAEDERDAEALKVRVRKRVRLLDHFPCMFVTKNSFLKPTPENVDTSNSFFRTKFVSKILCRPWRGQTTAYFTEHFISNAKLPSRDR